MIAVPSGAPELMARYLSKVGGLPFLQHEPPVLSRKRWTRPARAAHVAIVEAHFGRPACGRWADGRLYRRDREVRSHALMTGPAIGREIARHATHLLFGGLTAEGAGAIQGALNAEERARLQDRGYPAIDVILDRFRLDEAEVEGTRTSRPPWVPTPTIKP